MNEKQKIKEIFGKENQRQFGAFAIGQPSINDVECSTLLVDRLPEVEKTLIPERGNIFKLGNFM